MHLMIAMPFLNSFVRKIINGNLVSYEYHEIINGNLESHEYHELVITIIFSDLLKMYQVWSQTGPLSWRHIISNVQLAKFSVSVIR